ncbi:MAG: amidohydrolase family protein [Deltaproteobacteria bacterium]|nr:amidohydrolase family protein [Deltaproteobacteria bacterium]
MTSQNIRIKASHIIAFDGTRHRHLRDGELVYRGGEILYVGKRYNGQVDRTIDATGKVVSPGFISTHAHLSGSPLDRSYLEDCGNPQFYFSGLYDYLPIQRQATDRDMCRVCLEYSLAELLRNGTTTVVEMGSYGEDLASLVPVLGNRVYIGQGYRSGRWYSPDGKQVLYKWSGDQGMRAMEEAVEFIEKHDGSCDGLIRGLLYPAQVDTCTEELLCKSIELARKLEVPLSIHASQSLIEFNEMLRRNGKTPLAWLRDIGFLQERVILGHAIFIGGSSWTNYPAGDLEIMASSGCSVAHSPWVFARRGIIMESFCRYQQAGITMCLGTDTCPQNMIHAMRWAAVLSKTAERNTASTKAADVFNAATLGGAKALGRDDLGRLSPGAKADIVIFSGRSTNMVPLRDPVKNIVYNAEAEDVETVIVNGRTVVEGGKVKGVDESALNRRLQEAGERLWPRLTSEDPAHRSVDELSPPSLDPWEDGAEIP